MIQRFLDQNEPIKKTLAMEYNFGRKSGRSLTKDVCHVWELGGGVAFVNLLNVYLGKHDNTTLVLVLDLSSPETLWTLLETILQIAYSSLKKKEQTNDFKFSGNQIDSNHEDFDHLTPFPIPLLIIGSKYDLFEAFDPDKKEIICRTLRRVAHSLAASLFFYSDKDANLVKKLKDIFHHHGFGGSQWKGCSTDYNKPLLIPYGADSFSQLEINVKTLKSPNQGLMIERFKHFYTAVFPQSSDIKDTSIMDDPAKNPNFKEPLIDNLRLEKDEELERYQQEKKRRSLINPSDVTVKNQNQSFNHNEYMDKEFVLFLNEENILHDLEIAAIEYEKTVKNMRRVANFPPPPFRFQFALDFSKLKERSGELVLEGSTTPFGELPYTVFVLSRRSSILSCESLHCRRNKWQRYTDNIFSVCPECHGFMKEHIPSTDAGEEIYCQFVPLKAYHSMGRFQALNVRIKDELCNALELDVGEEYIITGRLNERNFEAMNIQHVYSNLEGYSDIPESIKNLHFEISQTSPNCLSSFVIALSSLLGSFLIPTSSFLNLKIGLMLCLATMEADVPVPLIAIGSDSLNAKILFQAAGKFAGRYVKYSAANSFLGGIIKPGVQADVICQEAGQLVFAGKGICDLGDWSKFKKEQTNYICQTIESGQILFNKGEFGKSNLTSFVPLKCSVWAYWSNRGKNSASSLQLKRLVNVFGIPFLADEKNELEHTKICLRNMSTLVTDFDQFPRNGTITPEDFREFFKVINSREVTLSESASQLIRGYFVVRRRDQPQWLPLGAIKTITALAEAHARLALRNEVLFEDVVAIIYLYEESLASIWGEFVLPYPKIPWDEKEPIYVWMSKQLREFSIWLEEYVGI
ncbi:hypothetical protein RUM43_009975 [Polyplax serrata]|uniref:Cytoplasmic dynein 2 light intermediate chain 1 n=1 Tax=Polyplax serrata TaxID=468196 RepID=A0AAN8PV73_POLSC